MNTLPLGIEHPEFLWANVSGEFWEFQSQHNCRMLACIAETVLLLLEGLWLIAFYEWFFLLRALNHSTVILNWMIYRLGLPSSGCSFKDTPKGNTWNFIHGAKKDIIKSSFQHCNRVLPPFAICPIPSFNILSGRLQQQGLSVQRWDASGKITCAFNHIQMVQTSKFYH